MKSRGARIGSVIFVMLIVASCTANKVQIATPAVEDRRFCEAVAGYVGLYNSSASDAKILAASYEIAAKVSTVDDHALARLGETLFSANERGDAELILDTFDSMADRCSVLFDDFARLTSPSVSA